MPRMMLAESVAKVGPSPFAGRPFAMSRRRPTVALSFLVLVAACGHPAGGGGRPSPETENVRRLAAILDYVAADYAGAVQGGAIKDAGEYQEQRSFMKDAAALA